MTVKDTAVVAVATEMPIKAKHVAAKFGMKPTALRRILRAMPQYADGVHTNYAWPSLDCAAVKEIAAKIQQLQKDKKERAEAAQAALQARAKQLEAAAKANAAAAK